MDITINIINGFISKLEKWQEKMQNLDFYGNISDTLSSINDPYYTQASPINIKSDAEWKRFTAHILRYTYPHNYKKRIQQITELPIIDESTIQDLLMIFDELKDSLSNSNNTNEELDVNTSVALQRIFTHFHNVADQLSRRHAQKSTLVIEDEYDVQDLLHALLRLYYDDIRKEEWTPSYAGNSYRVDFYIPEIETIIEVKKTRDTLKDKKLSEELTIDVAAYQKKEKCKHLFCFIYNPDRLLDNPVAIKNDIERIAPGFVQVFIVS